MSRKGYRTGNGLSRQSRQIGKFSTTIYTNLWRIPTGTMLEGSEESMTLKPGFDPISL